MRITLENGSVMERPFSPEACVGYRAHAIEPSPHDFIAMANMATSDLESFQAAMRQLSARLPSGRIRAEMASEISLVQMHEAYPELHYALLGKRQVGYLRLENGRFRVDFPQSGGTTVLDVSPRGDGIFRENERNHYLQLAKEAIADALAQEDVPSVVPGP